MAEKKSPAAAINFRTDVKLKTALEDLAYLSRRDVSSLLNEICRELVDANKVRIEEFRRSAEKPIKMPSYGGNNNA